MQIDIDGAGIGMRDPTEVNIVADAKTALAQLLPLLTVKEDRSGGVADTAGVSYAEVARTMGLRSITVDDPDQVGPAWDEALAASEPMVLGVRTDPEVPPIPPHVTYDQMKSTAEVILKGDPNGWHLFAEIAKNKAAEPLPRSGLRSSARG